MKLQRLLIALTVVNLVLLVYSLSQSRTVAAQGDAQQRAEPVLSEAPINPGLAKASALGVGGLLILMAAAKLAGY